jgi:AraC-like DNA-binding protein
VQRWSTDDVPPHQRFDYFVDALSSTIVPMRVDGVVGEFAAHMSRAEMGPVAVIHQQGTAHRSFRLREDISRSGEENFHLIINRSGDWTIENCGEARVAPGEALLVDSRYQHDLFMPDGFDVIHLKLGANWARQWMPSPQDVVCRRIGTGTTWGPALASFVASLSPQAMLDSAVSADVLVDQVGAMIALVAAEMCGDGNASRNQVQLGDRIRDCMMQRCGERLLDAGAIATSLRIDEHTLHAALAAGGQTFAGLLTGMRIDVSVRMLRSGAFRDESLATIAERAGFASASSLSRALRQRYGIGPALMRLSGCHPPEHRTRNAGQVPLDPSTSVRSR